jgi:hypothetical protein
LSQGDDAQTKWQADAGGKKRFAAENVFEKSIEPASIYRQVR